MRKSIRWATATAASLAAVLLLCGSSHAGKSTYKVGDKIADFALKDEAGKTVRLSQYAGRIVILNFYASW